MTSTCRICHKPLSLPASVERGIGPICWGKHEGGEELFDDSKKGHIVAGVFEGDVVISRTPEGAPVVNLPQQMVLHSPTGFEFGYGGSGPADLALNILLQYTDRDTALDLHQDFKWQFIASLPESGGTITGEVIRSYLAQAKDAVRL